MADIVARGVRFHVQRLAPHHSTNQPHPHQPEHPVVFIHGLFLDNLSSFYSTLANPVAHTGATVILYDLRGHGLSERPPSGYRVDDAVADLAALLDTLGIDGPVHLVGNSFGGTIALGFAVACPERVASMMLIEAHVPGPGWNEQMAATIKNIGLDHTDGEWGRWLARHRKSPRLAAAARDMITNTTCVADVLATEAPAEDALRALACPIHAVYGEFSDVLHHAYVLKRMLSRYTLTLLPDVDHWVLPKATPALRAITVEWFVTQAPVNAR